MIKLEICLSHGHCYFHFPIHLVCIHLVQAIVSTLDRIHILSWRLYSCFRYNFFFRLGCFGRSFKFSGRDSCLDHFNINVSFTQPRVIE